MTCLNLSNGAFSVAGWQTANFNDGVVTITRVAPDPGAFEPGSLRLGRVGFNDLFLNGDWRYIVFGTDQFVALLNLQPGAPGSSQRTVFIVDFTAGSGTPVTVNVHSQGNQQDSTPLPQFAVSPGNGAAAFLFSETGQVNEVQRLNIHRSDSGVVMLAGPLAVRSSNVGASITATTLVIDHPNTFGSDQTTRPRPAGECTVVGGNVDFGEAVIGAADASLATTTRTVEIRNDGDDCLTVTAIGNDAAYTVTGITPALGTPIDPGDSYSVTVVFAPAAVGNNQSGTLPITRTPANGDSAINCNGDARNARASIAVSTNSLNFGTVVIPPGTRTLTYTVTNDGEVNVEITINAPPAGSNFAWVPLAAPGLMLAPGATTAARNVDFTTATDGTSLNQTITVTPSQGTARNITCIGAGCIANALIEVRQEGALVAPPGGGPLQYGQIERGFRTVRFIEIVNTGDSDLRFNARIQETLVPAHATNFGLVLPENPITDAPSNRAYGPVLPATRCGPGPTGNNTVPVAVSFFADGANGAYAAELVIDTHNATNNVGQTWTFPLAAEIIDPVPIDIALVIDRSGSMNDAAWSRNKMEAALAGSRLLVEMLRDTADDRCAIVGFNELPVAHQAIVLAGPNRAALTGALVPANFTPGGATNIAGGAIVGREQLATAHPNSPALLKKALVVLTDGMENRCFQIGGAGTFFSITGRDAADGMRRPDGTSQDTDPLALGPENVYAIGLGQPGDIDAAALNTIAVSTGGSYQGAEDLTGKNYFLLEKYFTQIFMEAASLAQITDPFYTITAGEHHQHQFDILPGDVNAMIVMFDEPGMRLPFFIESPKGEILSGTSLPSGFALRFRSTPTARFAEFFFPVQEPDRYVGSWRVHIPFKGVVCEGEVGRRDDAVGAGFLPKKCRPIKEPVDYGIAIGAGSNLRLQPYVDPGVKFVGDRIRLNAEVAEAGLPVTNSSVSVYVTAPNGQQYVLPLVDDGAHEDGQVADGDYGGTFTQTYVAGNYQLRFTADGFQRGKPYHREVHRTKAVLDPRRPGGADDDGGRPGGGDMDECCRRLLRALNRQEKLLKEILKHRK
jgi:hypothetical protein